MNNSVQKTLIIVSGIIAIVLIGILAYSSFSGTNTVTGNGQATIKVIPDRVAVYFSIDTNGTTSKEATDENSEIVDKLTIELIKQGFEKSQIQTTGFNVYPDYDYNGGKETLKGYKASHSITVQMSSNDSGKIGDVIDAGVSAGAGISYINFELSQSKQNEYKAQALKLASEDAKVKAQAIASGLGKTLKRLVSVSDNSFNYYPWRLYESSGEAPSMDASAAKSATTNITPGEQEVSASVTAVFKI